MITDNIRLFTQSSIRIEGKYVIYVDPFHMKAAPYDADVIFLTHDHYDHFSPDDIARIIKSDTKIVAPEKMAGKARTVVPPKGELILVRPGERYEIPGLIIETIPAYNAKMQFHPKSAGWTGYCLEEDGQRIYISGDTDNTKQAQQVKCDVALGSDRRYIYDGCASGCGADQPDTSVSGDSDPLWQHSGETRGCGDFQTTCEFRYTGRKQNGIF